MWLFNRTDQQYMDRLKRKNRWRWFVVIVFMLSGLFQITAGVWIQNFLNQTRSDAFEIKETIKEKAANDPFLQLILNDIANNEVWHDSGYLEGLLVASSISLGLACLLVSLWHATDLRKNRMLMKYYEQAKAGKS